MDKEKFIGLWKLVWYEFRTADGKTIHPYGEDPVGWVMFDGEGHFSAQIMRRGRPDYTSATAGEKELRGALMGYVAYFGTYNIDEERKMLVNSVEGSLVPGWVGGEQVRYFEFGDDGRVTLRTPPIGESGAQIEGTLTWEKA